MNKSLITGLVAGAVIASAAGAVIASAAGAMAGYQMLKGPQFANVLDVKPVTKTVRTPRQVCREVQVTHQAPTKDPHQITGSVLGAVVGGVLGNQVGGGSGKKLATVAGAAAGGYAGNRVQKKMQQGNTTTSTEQHCETVYDTHEENVGYDVRYILDKKEGTVRMDRDPGPQIPVRDGKLVIEPAAKAGSAHAEAT